MALRLSSIGVLLLGVVAACSDDVPPQPDVGVDSGVDLTVDAPVDAGADIPADASEPDLVKKDGSTDGSTDATDGGPSTKKICPNPPIPPPSSGTCSVTQGTGSGLLLRGELLTEKQVLVNGHLLIEQGKIVCAACDCSGHSAYQGATIVACAEGVISPGLINPHDHLQYCLDRPRTNDTRYDHRSEWRRGLNGKPEINAKYNNPKLDGLRWGELRMIIGGATSILGIESADGLLRNLDENNEGLGKKSTFYNTFPLDDILGQYRVGSCDYPDLPSESSAAGEVAYVTHVAEGVIPAARNEDLCLSGRLAGGVDITLDNAAFIHAIGITAADGLDLALGGTSVIWSPRCNISLYGFTADVVMLHNLGVRLALGTDWIPTGSMNLLRELACADYLNQKHYGGFFSDQQLWRMVTIDAAGVSGVGDLLGRLEPGYFADVTIFDGTKRAGYAAVVRAEVTDVVLVMRGGEALYGEDALVAAVAPAGGQGCEPMTVCRKKRRVCLQREIGKTLAELKKSVGAAYSLYYCRTPKDEPTCVPSRPGQYDGSITAGDADGDGVPNSQDNCPSVFNPPRPMDQGQPDTDGDQQGDACDLCPMDPNTTTCNVYNPTASDTDADGIDDTQDNCPLVFNKDQQDVDSDGAGDACDLCAKLGIRELRDPALGKRPVVGTQVRIKRALVTAVRDISGSRGFYIREGKGPYEAIFVYTKSDPPTDDTGSPIKVGDEVTLQGRLDVYSKIDEIGSPVTITVLGSAPVDPLDVAAGELSPGSTAAEALESHLVRVKKVTVAGMVDPATTDAFWVSDKDIACSGAAPACSKVNDYLFDGSLLDGKPAVSPGGSFSSITGIVNGHKNDHMLEPRDAGDLVP
jgi:cytosine/adenosine deaminase-related metal-dependent hydrolase